MSSFLSFVSLFLILSSCYYTLIDGVFSEQPSMIVSTKRMEKTTHLHFYFHDILDGSNPTAMRIISPPNKSVGGFGTTFMMDDPLTEGPEPDSKIVGRAQGMYALASQHEMGLLMVLNFAFTEGIYNGSALSILGRNPILKKVREMPIVGGSGIFRFARGYALAKTVWLDRKSGDAVVEYNVTVSHL
ncbi:Dirigent protein [Quillaja saponaria]|uniref:Dirigent protein n=1 Tax=Quillaja saponaria TaxID=32244 RepID=A0AAD7QIW4_QUISA|nr:Dirigent protein [Quillaja saponaria]